MLGACIHIFRAHKINYEYIFGVTRQGSISQWAAYEAAMWMSVAWMTIWMWQISFTYNFNYQVLVLTLVWFLFACIPLYRFRKFRWEWGKVQFNLWISPFGGADIINLIWGSINTNLGVLYNDGTAVLCLYTSGQMFAARPVAAACSWLPDYLLLFRFAPIFLRGMQSFRRYYNSNFTMTLQLK